MSTTYRYNNVQVTDLVTLAVRVSRAIGVSPTGVNDAGNTTEVTFASDLTAGQKTLLDTYMAGSNLDVLPTTGNTIYRLDDINLVKAATGLDFDVYLNGSSLLIYFTKVLTTQEKNSFRGAVANLLVITQ